MEDRSPFARVLFPPVRSRIIREEAASRDDRSGPSENATLVGKPAITTQKTSRFQPVRVETGIVRAHKMQQTAGSSQLLRRSILERGTDAQIAKRFLQQEQTILQERLRRELDLLRQRR